MEYVFMEYLNSIKIEVIYVSHSQSAHQLRLYQHEMFKSCLRIYFLQTQEVICKKKIWV